MLQISYQMHVMHVLGVPMDAVPMDAVPMDAVPT